MNTLRNLTFLFLVVPALFAQHDRFGLPVCAGGGREFGDRTYFVFCHDSARKTPVWVGYELTAGHLSGAFARPARFRRDAQLAGAGATDADYKYSGFTRGHMAPAADFAWSADAVRTTFLLSNTVPQYRNANSGRWAQVEAEVRRIAANADFVYVFTGPIFDEANVEYIGEGGVAVPSYTFKVVLAVRGESKRMYAAIVPNQAKISGRLSEFVTTVEEVERRTGLDFFAGLNDEEERRLESTHPETL